MPQVAGHWHQLTAPKLLAIAPGDHVDFSDTFDVYLAGSPDWRVLVRGRECDNAGFKECDVPTELGENEDAGISVDSFHGTGAAGEHVARGTSEECQTAVGGPCYTLGYRVEDLGVLGAQSSVAPSTPPQAVGRTRPDEGKAK